MEACEKIDVDSCTRSWKSLPDMREGKCGFNPCLFRNNVYLCGFGSFLVEAFSPQTDRFLPLELQLPQNSYCCLYEHNGLLVVHSTNYICKFSAEQGGRPTPYSQVHTQTSVNKYSNSHPVVGREHFYIFQQTQVLMIHKETGCSCGNSRKLS